jgi:hypothetical protein
MSEGAMISTNPNQEVIEAFNKTIGGMAIISCMYPYFRKLQEIQTNKLLENVPRTYTNKSFLRRNYAGFAPYLIYTLAPTLTGPEHPFLGLAIPIFLYPLKLISIHEAVGMNSKEGLGYKSILDLPKLVIRKDCYRGFSLTMLNGLLTFMPFLNVFVIPLENIRLNYILSTYTGEKIDGYRESIRWNYKHGHLWRGSLAYLPFLLCFNAAWVASVMPALL